jgi:hypothetical protein
MAISVPSAVALAISTSWARGIVQSATSQDLGVTPVSLALLVAILLPVGWLAVVATLGAIAGIPAMLVFCARFVRLSGTKASGDTGEFIKAIRPVFLCVMLAFVPQMLTLSHFNQYPVLRKITAQIIMGLDYREQSVCGETKPKAARIDEHRFSVADANTVMFQEITCSPTDARKSRV